jgi:hypothetical protein
MSFPSQDVPSSPTHLPSSATLPEFPRGNRTHAHIRTSLSANGIESPLSPSATTHSRRHSRLHSRNLSIFFPRPGSLPHSTITEDGAQEIELPPARAAVPIPSASPTAFRPQQRLGEGFTFGGRPPSKAGANGDALTDDQPPLPRASRRGHHHKHSLSHNFFSFLEPGSNASGDHASLPTPTSPSPQSAGSSSSTFPRNSSSPVSPLSDTSASPFSHLNDDALPVGAVVAAVGQLTLGAWLWITGQGIGSLACIGLGYWVVFDAIGVVVNKILPAYLHRPVPKARVRRPFGCAPLLLLRIPLSSGCVIVTGLAGWKRSRCLHKPFISCSRPSTCSRRPLSTSYFQRARVTIIILAMRMLNYTGWSPITRLNRLPP